MKHSYYDVENWATANLMYFGSEDGKQAWCLTGIEVNYKFRGRGVASQLLKEVTDAADAEGSILLLSVDPDGTGLDYAALKAWYGRNGFVTYQEEGTMKREPRSVQTEQLIGEQQQ